VASLNITALSCHLSVVTLPGKQEKEKRFAITGMVRAPSTFGGRHPMTSYK
jgi:hypothetical protein